MGGKWSEDKKKYHSDEERLEARRKYDRKSYNKRMEDTSARQDYNKRALDLYQNNKDRVKQNNIKLQTPQRKFSTLKRDAKNRSIEINLTIEEFIKLQSDPCYYCGNTEKPPLDVDWIG